ncbi:hypothetical protein BST34_11970 [Mycolicibacterium monacense DSM 44395]|nr:hypothetical protein BST34_11970 [Mycolicibacterium monacense DSM 44395]
MRDAMAALPVHFSSQTYIEGLEAGDLFSLNSMLGGSIEIQVVQTLNRLRAVWDPDEEWEEYAFIRSSQTFPDVRLVTNSAQLIAQGDQFGMGIELKGWYLLSREGEPSFRYTVTRDACDIHDLLVVVPWHLKNVLSGEPTVYKPFVESARFAADMRNHYWSVGRRAKDKARGAEKADNYYEITPPAGATPYPPPRMNIADHANTDGGKNFGRVARSEGLMDGYVLETLSTAVSGIEARHWVGFFKTYAESSQRDELHARIARQLARDRLAQNIDNDDLQGMLREWISRLPLAGDEADSD